MPFVLPKSTLFPTGSNSLRNEGCFHITGESHKSYGSRCPGNFLQCRCKQGERRTRSSAPRILCSVPCVTPPPQGARCARQCPGRAGKGSCPFTRFNPVLQIPSRMLALGICLLLNSLSFILEILSFREDLEPCKGTCLCSYDQTLKKCLSFIFRGVIQEMEIDLLMRQRASRNVLVVFNVL